MLDVLVTVSHNIWATLGTTDTAELVAINERLTAVSPVVLLVLIRDIVHEPVDDIVQDLDGEPVVDRGREAQRDVGAKCAGMGLAPARVCDHHEGAQVTQPPLYLALAR